MGLSQAFIVGAAWSPFYGAMAAALTFAPEARLTQLIFWGIPVAVGGITATWFTLTSERHRGGRDFVGYPLHLEALWVPAVLAVCVLAIHEWQPRWSVLAVIAAMASLVTVVTLVLRSGSSSGSGAGATLLRHVHNRLPAMNGELTLFLAAGILSAGMTGAIDVLDLGLPFSHFGPLQASLVLIVMNLCAWIGLHPIILVSVLGPWIMRRSIRARSSSGHCCSMRVPSSSCTTIPRATRRRVRTTERSRHSWSRRAGCSTSRSRTTS